MKQLRIKNIFVLTAFALAVPVTILAQEDGKTDKEKSNKDKTERRHITITTKGDQQEKITVEINGEKVTVNGKPIEEYKDKDGDISVNVNKLRGMESLSYFRTPKSGAWSFNGNDDVTAFGGNENRAMLGVTTEKVEEGAEITSVNKESAADKAGLKENDIITKVDDATISSPDDLSAAVKKHKPGDKVSINYLRNKKEQKTTAELSKWKGSTLFGFDDMGQNFKLNMDQFNFDKIAPKRQPYSTVPSDGYRSYTIASGAPKLGISVQDTDDGKGVKVVNVLDESNAEKAGIKEDDIITQVDDKAVNSTDEIANLLKEKKDNLTVRFKLLRDGKTQNIEVKMPRKIKTTNL
ncbi:MAG: PDZ domain-containing protein [Chitinophagaceae bacterium]|nr:PDZ domain-containing protein [Chitinophagaceae bacterium]MBP8243364.1 PDZ domain-containing protein [Chitinophagaceae bacterium]